MGSGRGLGGGAPVQDEDYTDRKVAFTSDMTLWPEYERLSDHIHKDNHLTRFNWMPPSDVKKDGNILAVVGK
jgi:hypothetical protein